MDLPLQGSIASVTAPSPLIPSDQAPLTRSGHDSPTCDIEMIALIPAQDKDTSEQSIQNTASAIVDGSSVLVRPAEPRIADDDAVSAVTHQSRLQRRAPSAISRLLLDSWVCEIAALSFGVFCLGAIALIVGIYDGAKIPRFISGLTLNTIVSVLSTAARSSLIFVASATVGQSKWRWLRDRHRLHDIQALDDASRGPLGALSALLSFTGEGLAALGSVITLFLVAFSPFLQQLIDYPLRDATQPRAAALAPQVLAYTPFSSEGNGISRAIEVGTWSAPKSYDREPKCSTGHCSWPRFQSVGWCSKCENRTDAARLANCKLGAIAQNNTEFSEYCTLHLDDGLGVSLLSQVSDTGAYGIVHVNYTSEVIWPVSYGNVADTKDVGKAPHLSTILSIQNNAFFSGIRNPLMVFGHAVVEPAWGPTAGDSSAEVDLLHVTEASQCVLTFCERDMSLDRVDGVTTWSEESTNYGNLFARNLSLIIEQVVQEEHERLCWQAESGDLNLVTLDEGHQYEDKVKRAFCDLSAYESYRSAVEEQLLGRYDLELFFTAEVKGSRRIYKTPGESRTSGTVGPQSTRNFSQRLENIAIALTNYGLQTTNDTVQGVALAEESYVRVRWQWIALPALLELAVLVMLVMTIVQCRREDVPLWKSSVLALIYHGVDGLRAQESLVTERLSGIEATAKVTDVKLLKTENGVNTLSKRTRYNAVP